MNMRAGWILIALAGCKGRHEAGVKPDLVTGSGNVAEVHLGPANPGGDRELAFTITKVYEGQQPTSESPYHTPGGTWTYFDAKLAADPAATFSVGWPKLEAGDGGFGGFSKIWLVPTTADAGGRFVAAFAKAFHVDAPTAHPGTLAPMRVPIAVLGVGTSASDDGYAGTGTWDATKLFLSADGIDSAELFFNVSIAGKQGVFSEKDESYDADDLHVLAIALRDGSPPPRTPQNDPTLAARPLTLELGKQVGSRHMSLVGSSPKRAIVTDAREDKFVLSSIDLTSGEVKELYRTSDRLVGGVCDATADHCVVQEIHSNDPHSYSLSDPAKLVAVDGNKVAAIAVPGTGTSPRPMAMSPSGRFLIAGDYDVTVILDRKTGKSIPSKGTKEFREVVRWRSDTVALASSEDLTADAPTMHYGAWHLDTGVFEPIATALDGAPSPDGARTAAFAGGVLTVTSKLGGRQLRLDPRDARFAEVGCCKWLDSRYLAFPAQQFGVIDTDAMKIAFAPPVLDDEQRVEPILGTMQALVTKGEATVLARIVP